MHQCPVDPRFNMLSLLSMRITVYCMLSNLTYLSAELRIAYDTQLSKSVEMKSTDYKGKWKHYTGKIARSKLYNYIICFQNNVCPQPSLYLIIETNIN